MSYDDSSSTKRTRASGEVLDYLLEEFENNQNPLPEQRREIADRTNMNEKAVRIWFQNRRAKLRKMERMGRSSSVSSRPGSESFSEGHPLIPIEINEHYCFIDCSSLSVGSWQRLKSGNHDEKVLRNSLVNLAPLTIANVMNNCDLLVILSKKNQELNYFFAAVSYNVKVLFRIFYPLTAVSTCSLLDNNISKEQNELRLSLSHTPKFSVYFAVTESNQWSICEDFSEGQQVSKAFNVSEQSSTHINQITHVLVGSKPSLQYLNAYILENQLNGANTSSTLPGDNSITINADNKIGHHNINHNDASDSPSLSNANSINIDSIGLTNSISVDNATGDPDSDLRFDWQPQISPLGESETSPASIVSTGSLRREYASEMAEESLAPVSYTHQQHSPEATEETIQSHIQSNTPQSHDFEFVLGNDFVAHTPSENNTTSNQHVDSFIDYNSHYP